MTAGNGDAFVREPAAAPSLPPPRAADIAPQNDLRPAFDPPAHEPPAYVPPPAPSAPQGDAAPSEPAKPAQTYTVWSSTPGEGRHFGPKE